MVNSSKTGKNKNLTQKVTLNGPVQMIFPTFLDRERLSAFTQSDAQMEAKVGGAFKLFSGNVTGEFLEIVCFFFLFLSFSSFPFFFPNR